MVLSLGSLSAQITEGQITYKMEFYSDDPQMAAAIPMMNGSTMLFQFMKDKSAADITMGSFMKMNSIVDMKQDKGVILMDVMGQKIANNIESISKSKKEDDKIEKPVKTSETKKILGFNCTKYVIKDESGKGEDTVLWITSEIKTSLMGQKQFASGIEGVPLEFSSIQQGMNVRFEATSFDKSVNKDAFSLTIPEGYRVMTQEEMESMGG